jgi:hypothetical protein
LKAVKSTDKFYKVQQLWQWILNAKFDRAQTTCVLFCCFELQFHQIDAPCVRLMPMQTIQMPFRQRKSKLLFRKKSMDVKVFALVFFFLSKTHKVGCKKIT